MFDQPRNPNALGHILGTLSKAQAAKELESVNVALRIYRSLIIVGKQPQDAHDEVIQTFKEALHIEDSDPDPTNEDPGQVFAKAADQGF